MSRGVSEKTKKLTLSAVLAAMGVVLLLIGGVIEMLDLSMAAIASFFCIFAVIELRKGYPWLIYATTATLSIIMMPFSLGGWCYLLFFGFYPILKEKIEKLGRAASLIVKLGSFNLLVTVFICIFKLLFLNDFNIVIQEISVMLGGTKSLALIAICVYAVMNVIFVLYDIALTRLITLYLVRIRGKFKFLK